MEKVTISQARQLLNLALYETANAKSQLDKDIAQENVVVACYILYRASHNKRYYGRVFQDVFSYWLNSQDVERELGLGICRGEYWLANSVGFAKYYNKAWSRYQAGLNRR